ncbi:primosomal replication protein N [Parasulfuritortus cantonensis]|uniref:Primosomal replication protein N n=1 Tax=Parasulfuritortus cantonensis TaxID=2528202 RepID=A0A4V2NWF6_9PROT|nr:primosomal replication protein N [Parasulfuritortus cantonensis]
MEGRVLANDGLRRTPAGLASLNLRLGHESPQREAGHERKVQCELEAVAYGDPAMRLAALTEGATVGLAGFLERKSLRDPRPILHITEFEIKE